jgi:tryptophan 2,3-dioxygenase
MTDSARSDYERYVNTDALLACQKALDTLANDHELFFQVTHQVMELWLKVIAHELDVATGLMRDGRLSEAARRLRRVRDIERVLVEQMNIMESLAPADYHPIRRTLGHGSGQESPGFNRILHMAADVYAAFAPLLETHGVTLYELHQRLDPHEALFDLMQALMDVDAWFQRFREAHFHVVKRVIGADVKSLKGVPASMLEHTSKQPLFPPLWQVVNEFTKVDFPGY